MHIILFPERPAASDDAVDSLSALCRRTGPFGYQALRCFCRTCARLLASRQVALVRPPLDTDEFSQLAVCGDTAMLPVMPSGDGEAPWHGLTCAEALAQIDPSWLEELLRGLTEDVILLTVDPELSSFREKVRFDRQGRIIGFRRHYADVVWPTALPDDWPHHVLIRASAWPRLWGDSALPLNYDQFIDRCRSARCTIRPVRAAGTLTRLTDPVELREFVRVVLRSEPVVSQFTAGSDAADNPPRLFGSVSLGRDVRLGPGVVIVGPTVLGDRVTVGANTLIRGAIVPSDMAIDPDRVIDSCVYSPEVPDQPPAYLLPGPPPRGQWYRTWPRFSYVETVKRWADIAFSLLVLLLFLPFFPFVALAIKINSPGPLFFQHKRQGRYGREFGCIKFRTMIKDADKMQDQLRLLNCNQVDGPQFKMENDPRVSTVGKFLRDTCIDEIPQFINVLLGQMSVVGPRPSPERENTFCASWRDARLSVRPGITGLWQVNRTREEGQDFQEWVVHDTRYVSEVNWKLDLWICWRTVCYIVKSILEKF